MKIGIDARTMVGHRTGKGQYVYNLIKTLVKIDSKNQYFLYTKFPILDPSTPLGTSFKFPKNFKIKIIKWPSLFWHLVCLYHLRFVDQVDVFLASTSYIIPALGYQKSVVVVHDLFSFLTSAHQKKATIIERMTAKRAFTSAKKIIAISCNTKNDLVRLFKINPQKISVIYDGVDERFIPILDRNKIIQGFKKYNLPEKFFLFVSTLEPRKNVVRLLKAYDKLDKLVSFKATKLPHLVLVGQKGWGYREIFETINGARLKNKIVLLDYIKNEDLLVLYNAALAFVFPSLYEGFGLPVLEALACGCPVITSNISSLPEVGNNACLYVNPYQVDEIALAMKRILTDENLRKELQAKGLIQAKKFSWQKTAKETIKVLEI